MESKEFDKSKVFKFNESIEYTESSVVSKHIIKKETGNVSLFSFDKGEGLSEHSAPFDALVQIIDGTAEIRIGGKPYEMRAGECIVMPANIPHGLKALEKFKMVLTMIKS
jgi:quercetin dioxygenase-like cupin family protein